MTVYPSELSPATICHCVCDRRPSNVSEVAAAVAEAAVAGASSATQADSTFRSFGASDRADAASQDVTSSISSVDASAADSDNASAQAGEQQSGIDTDQMAMRLALDVLWTAGAKPPVQASGSTESDAS